MPAMDDTFSALRRDSEQLHTEISYLFLKERRTISFYLKQAFITQLFFGIYCY